MSCDRCEHIHEAQRQGKIDRSCKCECHGQEGVNDYIFNVAGDNSAACTVSTDTINLTSGTVGSNY